jgi:uncharacterized membrane protein
MSAFKRSDGVSIAVIGLSAAVTAAVYEQLPDPVATHFDLHGNANGWMPRAVAAWGMPLFSLALWAFVRFVSKLLPMSDKKRLEAGSLALVAALTACFMAAVHLVIIWVAITPGALITKPIFVLLGVFLVGLGLVMPRIKRNPIIGIRTAWTLRSDENWARTQRVGGYSMVAGGIGAAVFGAFGGAAGGVVAILAILVSAIVPAVYSLLLARRLDPKG